MDVSPAAVITASFPTNYGPSFHAAEADAPADTPPNIAFGTLELFGTDPGSADAATIHAASQENYSARCLARIY
jgi:hypothetical protein